MDWQGVCEKFEDLKKREESDARRELTKLAHEDPEAYKLLVVAMQDDDWDFDELDTPFFDHVTTWRVEENASRPVALEPGHIIGEEFEILSYLGQGASATVYRAFQRSLRRDVAIKVSSSTESEAQVLAQFDHPNIVKVYSQHRYDDFTVINLQFIDGYSLSHVLEHAEKSTEFEKFCQRFFTDRKMGTSDCWLKFLIDLMEQTLQALVHAHDQGRLHLDIKPSNILVDKQAKVYLADFGVSLNAVRSQQEVVTGGTQFYMAPEHERALFSPRDSRLVDQTSDLFSLSRVFEKVFEAFDHFPKNNHEQFVFNELKKLNLKNLQENKHERFQEADDFLNEVRRMNFTAAYRKHIGTKPRFRKFLLDYPIFSIVFFSLLPQLGGSIFNIFYNQSQILSGLHPAQQVAAIDFTVYYNLVVYPLAIGFFVYMSWSLLKRLFWSYGAEALALELKPEENQKTRWQILNLPRTLLIATAIGWLPGSFCFAWGIEVISGIDLGVHQQLHLFFSFFVSWLIASCFSYLFLQYLCLGVYYPYFLGGKDQPHKTAVREILPRLKRQIAFFMAGAIPLLGGIALVNSVEDLNGTIVRFLITYIIALGIVGMALGSTVGHSLNRLRGLIDNT